MGVAFSKTCVHPGLFERALLQAALGVPAGLPAGARVHYMDMSKGLALMKRG
jgi:hypothetical protein